MFSISPSYGRLSCVALDREVVPFYNLTIVASDNGVPPQQSICFVSVTVLDDNDNAPHFISPSYGQQIPENIGIDQSILRVEALDADIGVNSLVTYYINNTDNGNFQINNTTGEITTSG